MNKVAQDLISAIENYIKESSKVGYYFSEEEQYRIERMIRILNNQIDILIEYEMKGEK